MYFTLGRVRLLHQTKVLDQTSASHSMADLLCLFLLSTENTLLGSSAVREIVTKMQLQTRPLLQFGFLCKLAKWTVVVSKQTFMKSRNRLSKQQSGLSWHEWPQSCTHDCQTMRRCQCDSDITIQSSSDNNTWWCGLSSYEDCHCNQNVRVTLTLSMLLIDEHCALSEH